MARSYLEFTATGAATYAFHGLDYLSVAHLSATVDGTPVSATFDDATKVVTFATAPASGTTVRLLRTTPRKVSERLVDFTAIPDGTAGLDADDLNTDYRQNMLVAGEADDLVESQAVANNGLGLGADGWDAESLRIEDLADGSGSSDALTKGQLDTAAAGARNLPAVTGADDDDTLFVAAGEFDDRLPAEGRAHLGLGTAAVLNSGTGAGQAVTLDGSARFPANDGQNIDLDNHPLAAEIAQRATTTVVHMTGQASGNAIDPTVSTWSQNSSTRISLAAAWTARTELHNSTISGPGTLPTGVVRLQTGTYRIRFALRFRSPFINRSAAFRITTDDDTGSQSVYYDFGPTNIPSGSTFEEAHHSGEIIVNAPSQTDIAFRWAHSESGANRILNYSILIHQLA